MMMRQLRIATLGLYTTWFSYFLMGTAQGTFLNGHLHYAISLRQNHDQIEQQLDYFKPHIVFCHAIFSEHLKNSAGEPLERELLHEVITKSRKKWGFKVAYQEGDAKKNPRYPYPVTELIDLGLINNTLYQNFESLLKVKCIHWPYFTLNQSEPAAFVDNRFKHQLVFTGNTSDRPAGHLHYGRAEFLDKLNKEIPVKIFPDEVSGNTRFCSQEIAQGSSGVIGISQANDIDGYLDTRPFQYIGAGALFFMDSHASINRFFCPHIHYVPYARLNPNDFKIQYDYYMKHRDKAKKIRQEGFDYTQKWHSAQRRVQQVIDIFEGKNIDHPIYLEEIMGIENENLQ